LDLLTAGKLEMDDFCHLITFKEYENSILLPIKYLKLKLTFAADFTKAQTGFYKIYNRKSKIINQTWHYRQASWGYPM
jgi:hypothetical protein